MNITEIKSYINDRIDTNDNDFPNLKKTRMLNVSLNTISNAIISKDRLFQYDDPNYSDLNEGTLALTATQYIYDISEEENFANILYVAKVFLKNRNGEYYELPKGDIVFDTLSGTQLTGEPTQYRIVGKKLVFDRTLDYTQSNGIKIYFARTPEPILANDTVKIPGIPLNCHRLLCLLTCFDFASAKNMAVKNDVYTEIQTELKNVGLHIDKNNSTMDIPVITVERVNSC
jgi:hypothetical protein